MVSIDGYGAGPNQDLENPIGVGGVALMEWFFSTRTWRHMLGQDDGETGVDNDIAAQGETVKSVAGDRATHVFLRKRA